MKSSSVLIGLLALATLQLFSTVTSFHHGLDRMWAAYKHQHHKFHKDAHDEQFRRKIWEDTVSRVQLHNLNYDLGLVTYTLGINEYSDLTVDEYNKYLLGAKSSDFQGPKAKLMFTANSKFKSPGGEMPAKVDWRDKGYVTPIKNQGQCGSCWAFSTTGSLEGQHYHKTGRLVPLSEQNLIDCTQKYGNAGCNGGWMDNAFKYIQENGGIDTEEYYPYEAIDDVCGYNAEYAGANATGFVDVAKNSETDLQAAVASIGPISIGIDASHESFRSYRAGVYVEPECSTNQTDHAVLAVGYGTENGQDYWLVKNSWGTSWGMDGYIKMARNKDNMCCIACFASFPTV